MKKLLTIYSCIFVLFCFFSFLYVDKNFIYLNSLYSGFATNQRIVAALLYFLFISLMFVIYVLIMRKVENNKKAKWFLLVPLIGIFAYPAILSFDLFNYIATAKVAFHYFENPYIIMPIEFAGEPVLIFTRAANKIALYGPAWVGLSSIPFYLSGGYYLLAIVLFKLFVSLFYFGIIGLIWKISKNIHNVFFFVASPLVLTETLISGHNDVVMMFFALASIYFLKDKKNTLAILLLIVSVLIKYSTVFFVPLFIYYYFQRARGKDLDWDNFYLIGFVLMTVVFFLSPIREEIYPWYAIWPLTLLSLIANKKKTLTTIFTFFTYCLMLRYIPYMLTGNYFGITPYIKLFITFIVPSLFILIVLLKNKLKFR